MQCAAAQHDNRTDSQPYGLHARMRSLAAACTCILACAFACTLFVLPSSEAYADTGYCSYCGQTRTGTYYYPAAYGCVEPTCTSGGSGILMCSVCGQGNRPQPVPALGHNHVHSYSTATCTEGGQDVYVCTRCGDSYSEYAVALGHLYYETDITEPTCTEKGSRTNTCARCGDETTEELDALGHDYVHTTIEPTCTKTGTKTSTCSRCGDEHSTLIAMLGHDWKELSYEAPTCVAAGERHVVCLRCGLENQAILESLGHEFPEAWTVQLEPTLFEEGLEYRLCERCGEREERAIGKLSLFETPVGFGLLGGIVVVGGAVFFLMKRPKTKDLPYDDLKRISITAKKIFANLSNEASNKEFLEVVKSRSNLSLVLYDPEKGTTLSEQIAEADPHAVVLDFAGEQELDKMLATIEDLRAEHGSVKFEAIAFGADEAIASRLDAAQNDDTLFAYAKADQNKYVKLARLVVPLYKDFMKSADSLDNVGDIAELFGIPAVPTFIATLAAGRRIEEVADTAKDIFAGEELEFSDGVSVTNAIAELLGLDTLTAATNLVSNASAVDKALQGDEESTAYTTNKAKKAVKNAETIVDAILK